MKTMCPPSYHHSGFVATHALGHMMYSSCAQVHGLPQSHCGDNRDGTLYILNIHIYRGQLGTKRALEPTPLPPPTPRGSSGGAHGNFSKV